ncbi:hypothetical protein [Flavobacterium sp. JAS]|uniref:hypothetical protein n=1 Tax=Flavobacterium sp. JAS TaxID=2897329 RepID=UPI00351D6F8B
MINLIGLYFVFYVNHVPDCLWNNFKKNMGDEAEIGSTGLVMAIVGGALMPVLQGSILD